MKKLFYTTSFILCCLFYSKPISSQTLDTINLPSYSDAMNLVFGMLPKTHYPSGFLFTKTSTEPKINYANGLLNDSSFNMLEFYFIQNTIRMSYTNPDSFKHYLYLDSLKNDYIEQHNTLPWGIVDITGHNIKDSAFIDGSILFSNHQLIETTPFLNKIYSTTKRFCVAPLNMEIYTLNPQFIIKPEYVFSNNTNSITSIYINLDDGLGFKAVSINNSFQANYSNNGYKQFITRIVYTNGDTLYSRSELNVIANDLAKISSIFQPYDDIYNITPYPLTTGAVIDGNYPSEFSQAIQPDGYAEVGVWYGCNNISKKIRKPIVIFGGYNPKNGKALQENVYPPWINNSAGGILAIDGWRGPLYETYDGFFTDVSKNANGGQGFGSNGNRLLDKLRQEGYDVLIVRFYSGIGYLQTNAFLASLVLKDINKKILSETDNTQKSQPL